LADQGRACWFGPDGRLVFLLFVASGDRDPMIGYAARTTNRRNLKLLRDND
jgi:hypothetical protein